MKTADNRKVNMALSWCAFSLHALKKDPQHVYVFKMV